MHPAHLREVDSLYDVWSNCPTSELEATNPQATKRSRTMTKMQKCLIAAQELGDEKLQIVTQLQELIDHKTRQLDHDFKNLDYGKDEPIVELKETRAGTASPPMTSPINTTSIVAQIVTQVTSPSPAVSTLVAMNTSGSTVVSGSSVGTVSAGGERVSTASTAGTVGTGNTDRGTKRARRTRTETNSASGSTGSGGGNGNGGSATQDVNNSDSNLNSDSPAAKASAQVSQSTASSSATQKKGAAAAAGNAGGKKKKRKTRGATGSANTSQTGGAGSQNTSRDARDDTPPIEEQIDPDEPTYCLCDQISFGEMILCDNDLCPIEWFHFSCVSLLTKPKGKWFCPNCRGDRANVMKPKQQFLKELERYNKEKEEKT